MISLLTIPELSNLYSFARFYFGLFKCQHLGHHKSTNKYENHKMKGEEICLTILSGNRRRVDLMILTLKVSKVVEFNKFFYRLFHSAVASS